MIDKIIRFCLENKLVVTLLLLFIIIWGIVVAPFDWDIGFLPREPLPVDAIPDLGENQQIVFTEWMGRSPQDVEDQITYPLTVALLGMPSVKTIRSYSMFGFSTIYVIFKEKADFYESRSRVLEKLSSLPAGTLPESVRPVLGPDATALGQVFWYTLEGRDEKGKHTGGWDLQELRTIQDWQVRYALMAAEGVSEVASVGGYVQEYQVDVDPNAMRAAGVRLEDIVEAVKMSNLDVGARSIEVNKVDYLIRGVGFVKAPADLETAVIKVSNNVPIYVKNVAQVRLGPAQRMGALDKAGAEVVGGVVVVRYGENPLQVIKNVKAKIAEIATGLPKKRLEDGTVSQVQIVPFYDRTGLIYQTLETLNTAILQQILVTIIVILVLLNYLRSSVLISGLLPVAVLLTFIAMKYLRVDANIVALSGIAIAIGTVVDMGIILSENILRHLNEADPKESRLEVVFRAASEVGSAILTAVSTTVVSFLPVFTMQAAEGKLFKPLAFTKTFALISSVLIALTIIPTFAQILFTSRVRKPKIRQWASVPLLFLGFGSFFFLPWWPGVILIFAGAFNLLERRIPPPQQKWLPWLANGFVILIVLILVTRSWLPLGVDRGLLLNLLFIILLIGGMMAMLILFKHHYTRILAWALKHKAAFLAIPTAMVAFGLLIWLGFDALFGWLPRPLRVSKPVSYIAHTFPGLGKEFMPALDEGSFLYMPTTMPHASISEVLDVVKKQDQAFAAIPEVALAVGKIGRAESALDPAPISMIETIINYHDAYLTGPDGKRQIFRFDADSTDFFRNPAGDPVPAPDGEPYRVQGAFIRDANNSLIPERGGKAFRLWRPALEPALNPGRSFWPGVSSAADIWDEILAAGEIPGTTSAPILQPIAARIVMLQSGMRAPMGIKVQGPDLETIERVGLDLEQLLKNVPAIDPNTVIADRSVGVPYLEIKVNREAIARHGIHLNQVQEVIETAIGGIQVTTTVEGRERYPVRVRYQRELRDSFEAIEKILVAAANGAQIPLIQLVELSYRRGPQMIRSEDTFLTGYVIFDKQPEWAEVEVVEQARTFLEQKLANGEFELPAGVSYRFAGSYENQLRAQKQLSLILPLSLFIIFLILYFQFKSVPKTALVFTGIFVAWAGGFVMLWLYGQSWFLDFHFLGINLREILNIRPYNLSVAVWVGFLALFGIATDDGVLITTYLNQSFAKAAPKTIEEIRAATLAAGQRRMRPALMTTATTVLALLPVLTATGRGADIMVPMAIPSFGGMVFEVITMLVVPVLYAAIQEFKLKRNLER